MSSKSWQVSLRQALKKLQKANGSPRVVVVGIGHELRGDDLAGIAVARDLQQFASQHDRLLVIEAGSAPENTTGLMRRFGANLVVLVDAAQMDEAPGTVRWLPWDATAGISASTHTLPIRLLATYLVHELGCEVALVGIQPARNTIGAALSPVVQEAVEKTVSTLKDAFVDIL